MRRRSAGRCSNGRLEDLGHVLSVVHNAFNPFVWPVAGPKSNIRHGVAVGMHCTLLGILFVALVRVSKLVLF